MARGGIWYDYISSRNIIEVEAVDEKTHHTISFWVCVGVNVFGQRVSRTCERSEWWSPAESFVLIENTTTSKDTDDDWLGDRTYHFGPCQTVEEANKIAGNMIEKIKNGSWKFKISAKGQAVFDSQG